MRLQPNAPFTVAALAVMALAAPARADKPLSGARQLLDLTPERIAAFREALREFATPPEPPHGARLELVSEYFGADEDAGPPLGLLDEELVPPPDRDVAADEEFFVAGREDDYLEASRDWVERRLKGSSDNARPRPPGSLSTRLAWNHGPVVGVGRGPFVVEAGMESWRLRWSRPVNVSPAGPWRLSAFLGESDDDGFQVGFTIGRSLLHASHR